jgi:lipid-A-disaccharide synthase
MFPTIFISAGEASGEHYGALLVEALTRQLAVDGRTARFFGMGGERMESAGLEVVVRSEEMAVMGLTEVVRHLPRIYGEFRKLKRILRERRPDVAVLIDFPEIHFRLAKELHRLGIPVIFFVSPQLWAWKKHRIKLVRRFVDKMLVIFPFEEPFYRGQGVEAEFVGHPLADLPLPAICRKQFAAENGLDPEKTWIGLLPGSRPKEIQDLLPEMLQAAWALEERKALAQMKFEFLLPLAPTLNAAQREAVQTLVDNHGLGLDIRLVRDARAALFHARASVVASGTYAIAKRVVTVPHVAMVNLIAGKRAVPELIQDDFTAANIVQEIEPLLPDGAARQSMMKELGRIHGLLNTRPATSGENGAIGRVAEITLELLASEPLAIVGGKAENTSIDGGEK